MSAARLEVRPGSVADARLLSARQVTGAKDVADHHARLVRVRVPVPLFGHALRSTLLSVAEVVPEDGDVMVAALRRGDVRCFRVQLPANNAALLRTYAERDAACPTMLMTNRVLTLDGFFRLLGYDAELAVTYAPTKQDVHLLLQDRLSKRCATATPALVAAPSAPHKRESTPSPALQSTQPHKQRCQLPQCLATSPPPVRMQLHGEFLRPLTPTAMHVRVSGSWRKQRKMSSADFIFCLKQARCCDLHTGQEFLCTRCCGKSGRPLVRVTFPCASGNYHNEGHRPTDDEAYELLLTFMCSAPWEHLGNLPASLVVDLPGNPASMPLHLALDQGSLTVSQLCPQNSKLPTAQVLLSPHAPIFLVVRLIRSSHLYTTTLAAANTKLLTAVIKNNLIQITTSTSCVVDPPPLPLGTREDEVADSARFYHAVCVTGYKTHDAAERGQQLFDQWHTNRRVRNTLNLDLKAEGLVNCLATFTSW
eukprot:TRINITY_DN5656_c0_g1_i2.p1 TRINITY_DN5656_c0_g1~~TRINITY_DN5656_c0_g1_i2.p1  ORF type:complete len:479 (-),score=84.58 TRINITY_DN5656_c0_g1_i2:42-1478(-)